MRSILAAFCAAALTVVMLPAAASAQRMSASGKVTPDPGITLKVTVNISRWEGDKKVGNSPFVLLVVPSWGERAENYLDGDSTSIQIGGEYPTPPGPNGTVTYKSLGTNIRASAKPADEGRYNLFVSVQDTHLDKPQGSNQVLPNFQSFRSDNRLTMRDGQTIQYTVATDAISGQVIKLDVTMNVLK
jgi:hypothetical protein